MTRPTELEGTHDRPSLRAAFVVVSDHGYERAQVDAYLVEQTSWDLRAAEPFEASRADRHEVEQLVEEARRKVHWSAEEVEAAAERGAVVVMIRSQPHLDEIRRGLDLLDAQRQAVLGNLFRLRETLDGLAVEMPRAG